MAQGGEAGAGAGNDRGRQDLKREGADDYKGHQASEECGSEGGEKLDENVGTAAKKVEGDEGAKFGDEGARKGEEGGAGGAMPSGEGVAASGGEDTSTAEREDLGDCGGAGGAENAGKGGEEVERQIEQARETLAAAAEFAAQVEQVLCFTL